VNARGIRDAKRSRSRNERRADARLISRARRVEVNDNAQITCVLSIDIDAVGDAVDSPITAASEVARERRESGKITEAVFDFVVVNKARRGVLVAGVAASAFVREG